MVNNVISKIYHQESRADQFPDLSPDAVRLLRGMLSLTPASLAKQAGVKKNQLIRYENGERELSSRDKRWLRSYFVVAGADIFKGQGALQVTLDDDPVIVNGSPSDAINQALTGCDLREARINHGLSQKRMAKMSGIPQHIISMMENRHKGKYHLSDALMARCFFSPS